MHLTFLGTGTSTGVPQIGCSCSVCTSPDARDRRLRTSALVETTGGTRLLIDCGPDFRQQMLPLPFARIDAVLLTHLHYDHVGGIDDLRPFCRFGDVPIYGNADTLRHLRETLPYCFAKNLYPGVPHLHLIEVEPLRPFTVNGTTILPLPVLHGALPILGYRIANLAYITDLSSLPAAARPALTDVHTLVVNALRREPHATHQSIDEAIALAQSLAPRRTFLTHLSHHAGRHADIVPTLPPTIDVAYDGLCVEVEE